MMPLSSASLRLCAILLAASAHADEPPAWKWAAGDEARYHVVQTLAMQIEAGPAGEVVNESRQELTLRWSVESVEDGAARIKQTTERVFLKNDGIAGQKFEYDSASEGPPMGMAALVAPMYQAMVDHPYQFTMRPTGEITDVEFDQDFTKALDNLPGGAASGELAVQMAGQLAPRFPTMAPETGKGWTVGSDFASVVTGPLQLLTDYTPAGGKEVEGRKLKAFTLASRFAPDAEGKKPEVTVEMKASSGEVLFDREKGRLDHSKVSQTMSIEAPSASEVAKNEVVQTIEWRALGPDAEEPSTAD